MPTMIVIAYFVAVFVAVFRFALTVDGAKDGDCGVNQNFASRNDATGRSILSLELYHWSAYPTLYADTYVPENN